MRTKQAVSKLGQIRQLLEIRDQRIKAEADDLSDEIRNFSFEWLEEKTGDPDLSGKVAAAIERAVRQALARF